jgi:putative transposase
VFIQELASQYPVRLLCHVLRVHPSGFYAWQVNPLSDCAMEDKRLLGHIRHSLLESGSVYGYRKVTDDLRDLGKTCSERRVYRLMRDEKLRSQTGYHRRPGKRGGSIADIAPNHLHNNSLSKRRIESGPRA